MANPKDWGQEELDKVLYCVWLVLIQKLLGLCANFLQAHDLLECSIHYVI